MKKFPPVKRDKESGLPKKYVAGLSKSTAKARAAHWKKRGKLDPSDASAYKPAPGDATAKTKPSKYTTMYHSMYDKAPIEEQTPDEMKRSERSFAKFRKRDRYIQVMNKRMHHFTKHSQFEEETQNNIDEHIVKVDGKYRLVSKKTGRNLGTYNTKAGAMKRERQVQYFKHMGEEEMKESVKTANPGSGYHGQHPADKADAKYAEMFHKVRRSIVGGNATDKKIRSYLDSTHGRHLAGRENDTEYLHKDFKRFEKNYNPQKFDEGKSTNVIAAITQRAYEPKVGDHISTIKGGQNTGKVEKIEGNHVYFRSDYKRQGLGGKDYHPLFRTHSSNVRLHEEVAGAIKSFLGFAKKPEAKKPKASWETQKKFFAHLQKQTQTSMFQQPKGGKIIHVHQVAEEVEQVDENYRTLAMKGIGAERKEDIKVGHGVDYYHPKDGSKHMGKIHSMNDKGYTVKDDKTGEKHNFQYYRNINEGAADTSLAKKAAKSGISVGTLRKVFNRGKAAWRTGHRPGTTPDQWGHARVNSYITKGKTYRTADKDLHRESLDVNEAFKKEFGDEIE